MRQSSAVRQQDEERPTDMALSQSDRTPNLENYEFEAHIVHLCFVWTWSQAYSLLGFGLDARVPEWRKRDSRSRNLENDSNNDREPNERRCGGLFSKLR